MVLHEIYTVSDGFELFGGSLTLYPLGSSSSRVALVVDGTPYGTFLRIHGWSVPDELIVFGDNGAEVLFGMWLPLNRSATARCEDAPVISIAELGAGLALAATSMRSFLSLWTAYYLLQHRGLVDTMTALNYLDLPPRFQHREATDDLVAELTAWADPSLPDCGSDPYRRPVSLERLHELLDSR